MINLQYLKEKRHKKRLSQDYMAKQLGYKGRSGYMNLETGQRKLSLEKFIQISELLQLDLSIAIKEVAQNNTSAKGGEENV